MFGIFGKRRKLVDYSRKVILVYVNPILVIPDRLSEEQKKALWEDEFALSFLFGITSSLLLADHGIHPGPKKDKIIFEALDSLSHQYGVVASKKLIGYLLQGSPMAPAIMSFAGEQAAVITNPSTTDEERLAIHMDFLATIKERLGVGSNQQ